MGVDAGKDQSGGSVKLPTVIQGTSDVTVTVFPDIVKVTVNAFPRSVGEPQAADQTQRKTALNLGE